MPTARVSIGFRAVLVVAAVIVSVTVSTGAVGAVGPSASQRAGILAAFRGEQGNASIQRILISSANPAYASLKWGFAIKGRSAINDSLLQRNGKTWRILWTREIEQSASGACIYVPAAVAKDLLKVSCPPPATLRARPATEPEFSLINAAFRRGRITPYAKNSTGLSNVCISNADSKWAGAVAGFESGGVVFVFFHQSGSWSPVFETLLQQSTRPPERVLLSLALCVGYNPAEYA